MLHFVPIGQKRWPNIETFENKDANGQQHAPGWGLDALKCLIEERRVEAVGHESIRYRCICGRCKNGGFSWRTLYSWLG